MPNILDSDWLKGVGYYPISYDAPFTGLAKVVIHMGIKGNVTTQRESLGTQKGMKMSENRTENRPLRQWLQCQMAAMPDGCKQLHRGYFRADEENKQVGLTVADENEKVDLRPCIFCSPRYCAIALAIPFRDIQIQV